MIEGLSRARRNVALLVLGALVAWFAWSIRSVLNPVLLGYLIAFILTPIVSWFEQRGFNRRTSVNLTFVGGFLAAGLLMLALAWQVYDFAEQLRESSSAPIERPAVDGEASQDATAEAPTTGAPTTEEPATEEPATEEQTIEEQTTDEPTTDEQTTGPSGSADTAEPKRPPLEERVQRKVDAFRDSLRGFGIPVPEIDVDLAEVRVALTRYLEAEGGTVGRRAANFVAAFVRRLIGLAGLFVLLPLYAYYFLFVGKDVEAFVRRHLPRAHRERIARVLGQIGEVVASFFRGRLSVCVVKGLLLSIGLKLVGIEFAFLLGMLSGLLSVIPFFGPFLGFLLAFLSGLAQPGDITVLGSLVRTGVVFGLGELLEGYVLIPKILGDSLGLHPLVVFVALLAGGAALGMLGVIVALPLTATIVILVREFVLPALEAWADEEPGPDAAG